MKPHSYLRVAPIMPALALIAALFACSKEATPTATAPATSPAVNLAPYAVTDHPRIISTVPAATLNLILLNATDSLVGVSSYDTLFLPDEKRNLPVVGDYEKINYETLIALKPTAVIIQSSPAHIPERLLALAAEHHFNIINIKLDSTEDLWSTIQALGHAAREDDTATVAVLKAKAQLKAIAASIKGKARPTVVYVISQNPLMVVGDGSFMDETLTLAGAQNAAAKIGRGFVTISNETLVNLAPDILLIAAPSAPEQIADDPRLETWQRFNIPAVINDRVYLVTDGDALTATLNLPKTVRGLAELIHKSLPGSSALPATQPAIVPKAPAGEGSKP